MSVAVASRLLQFRAGPNETTFHACEEHKALLERPDGGVDLFFATDDQPVRTADPDDGLCCYFCREGGD